MASSSSVSVWSKDAGSSAHQMAGWGRKARRVAVAAAELLNLVNPADRLNEDGQENIICMYEEKGT